MTDRIDLERSALIRVGNSRFAIVACLALLAGGLRFYCLGTWPYGGDETASLTEESVLFHGQEASPDSQTYRLPHLIPLGYLVLHASHTLFGLDEWGSRVLAAALGTLSVLIVFVFLDAPQSHIQALVAALLVALMPQHVMHSQETRFYIVAAFFAFGCLLTGAKVFSRLPVLYATLASCLALLASLAHTLLLALVPLLVVAVWAGAYADRRAVRREVRLIFSLAALAMLAITAFHVRPLITGWNHGESWGYSPGHAVLASIVTIGWPIALLAILGLVLMLRERAAQDWYWLTCCLGWMGATVIVPLVIPYHAEYLFPLALSAIVPASRAIASVHDQLLPRSSLAARAWILLACLLNLPSLVSYYVDGSRWDDRTAARYVAAHWRPGDRVTGYSMDLFEHYSSHCCAPTIPLGKNSVPLLRELATVETGRLWIVLENTRAGIERQTQRWLFDCAVHKLTVGHRRFDDAVFSVEVYLVSAPASAGCAHKGAD